MFRFFKKSRSSKNFSRAQTKRHFQLNFREMKLSNEKFICLSILSKNGQTPAVQPVAHAIYDRIVRPNINSLFMVTTPTIMTDNHYLIPFHPGHNFTFVTNDEGTIVCHMSKRAAIKRVREHKSITAIDPRFKNTHMSNATVSSFEPKYTSIDEEITLWLNMAHLKSNYPMFIRIYPFGSGLDIDLKTYQENVQDIQQTNIPYILFSYSHESGDYYCRPENCNHAAAKSIFGRYSSPLENEYDFDLSTQETSVRIGRMLARDSVDQLKSVENELENCGLPHAVMSTPAHVPSFTC